MINMKIMVVLLFVGFLFFSFGCIDKKDIEDINQYPEVTNGKSIYFEKICTSTHNVIDKGIRNKKGYVITNNEDYNPAIESCNSIITDKIDFTSYTVIGLTLGYQADDSGQRPIIDDVVETSSNIFIMFNSTSPGNLAQATVIYPTSFYKIKKNKQRNNICRMNWRNDEYEKNICIVCCFTIL